MKKKPEKSDTDSLVAILIDMASAIATLKDYVQPDYKSVKETNDWFNEISDDIRSL